MRRRYHRTPEREEILTISIHVDEEPSSKPVSLKILLLEDRADFQGVLTEYLLSSGHKVTSVQSGVEGVREVLKAPFDLILCDMMMPNMGGEMFYVAVTTVRPAAGRRFIFFTGHRNNPALEAFFKRVNATVLYKPFQLFALDGAIAKVVRNLM